MKPRHPLIIAALMAMLIPAPSSAQDSAGFRLVVDYDGRLLIKVLDIRIEQDLSGGRFTSSARMKSYGVLSLFKRLDVTAQTVGQIRNDRAAPARFRHSNMDGVHNRAVEVIWRPQVVETTAAPAYPSPGDPAPTRSQKLAAADPLTELLRIAMSAPERQPCSRAARLFDGRQLYALEFSAPVTRAQTSRERSLGLVNGVRCRLKFSEVAGFDAKPSGKRDQGLKGPLTIDFARAGAGGPWVISGARGPTPLGDATVEVRALHIEMRSGQLASN